MFNPITFPKATNKTSHRTKVRSRANRLVALIIATELISVKAKFNWLVEATPENTQRMKQLELRHKTLLAMAEVEMAKSA